MIRYSSRFFLYAPVVLFLALTGGIMVHWWWTASALSARIDTLNGKQVMPGVTLRFAGKEMAGFPFRLDAVFHGMSLSLDMPSGPIVWRSENFAFHTLTYGRPQSVLEAAGNQTLDWTGTDGAKHHVTFLPATMRASAIADASGLLRFDMEVIDAGSPAFTIQRAQFHLRKTPGADTMQLVLDGTEIRLSQPLAGAFGNHLKSAHLNATLDHAAAFDGLRAARQSVFDALEKWRNAGGHIAFSPAELDFDRMTLALDGRLSLDALRRPAGRLSLKLTNASVLTAPDIAPPEEPQEPGLSAALRMLAARQGADAGGTLAVPLNFVDGALSVSGAPAGHLWPTY